MKKLLVLLFIFISTISFSKVRVHRSSSRPKVNRTKSYSKPKPKVVKVRKATKPTHKAAIRPKTSTTSSNQIIKTKPIVKSIKPINDSFSNSNKYMDYDNDYTHSNFSSSSYNSTNNNSGFGLFDYMILNSIFNNSNNNQVKEQYNINDITDKEEIIKILEKEIKEEEKKFEPNKEKIKKYKRIIEELKKGQ